MTYLATPSHRARASRAGRAMGDAESTVPNTPAGKLLEQINRFTARGQYGGVVYPVASGTVPPGAATTAAIIYQTRLVVAQTGIVDPGTAAQLAAVNQAMASGNTVSWVAANIGTVTAVLKGYADSQGLPYPVPGGGAAIVGLSPLGIAVLGVAAYVLFFRRKGA